jgi:enterochelin esterase-like enzyme
VRFAGPAAAFALMLAAALAAFPAPDPPQAPQGQVLVVKVHGAGLEGNLSGDSPDREVSVYLPPGYQRNPARRYPVLYMLHGFTDRTANWMGVVKHFINLPEVIDKAIAAGVSSEMIVVMPDAFTHFQGSMYSSSVVTGDWEGFVASELVAYIDGHYRTLANPESRGLAGHSMGGYGTLRIAMKRPGVFSSVYALSACCLAPPGTQVSNAAKAETVASFEELEKAEFLTKAVLASAAAWSPDPQKPPLYIDLPTKNGELQPGVIARWSANAPVAMADQYLTNLRRFKAIAFDVGDKDRLAGANKDLDQILTSRKVAHNFEVYDGDHVNHIASRVESKVLPFFTRNLVFESGKH